jgi:hypothetical protein
MNIGTAALELGSRMGLNVVFAHEAYRNGKDDGEEGQRAETDRAVEGHVDAALALMAGYGAGSVGGAFMVEAKVYDNARKKNDTETISKIQERYDSSADYWKLMEDGSLKYDGDGWLKDSMGNYILDENKKMIGADAVEGGLINIFKLNDNPENRAIVQKMMKDAGMTELEPKIWWKHDGNMGKAITLDDAAYASIYDKVLFDHNPLNIYSKLVKAGEMIQTPEYQAFTETFRYKAANIIGLGDKVAKLFGVEKYISYDEYKANNFMSGTPVYQTRNTFSDYEVNTLLGATGNLSPNPHRGTDGLVGSGVNSLLLFFNDTSKVVYPPKDNPSDDKKNAQGLYTTIATDITYTFKGKEIKDTVYFRTMHLSEVKVTAGDALTWDTVLGKTGNTGQLTNQQTGKSSGYGNHAHEDIYTNGSPSIYLDYLTRTTPDVMSTVYYKLENNFFYDKFLFADRTKYKIGTNAHLYNR